MGTEGGDVQGTQDMDFSKFAILGLPLKGISMNATYSI